MNKAQSLKKYLSLRMTFGVLIPFVVISTAGFLVYAPILKKDIEVHQQQLAHLLAAQVESFLTAPVVEATELAGIEGDAATHLAQELKAHGVANAIYICDLKGKVLAVSLQNEDHVREKDLLGNDLSRLLPIQQISKSHVPVWSDTFLSSITNGLAVSVSVKAKNIVVSVEIELKELSAFLQKVSSRSDENLWVLDRFGQIIADEEKKWTAQQFNVSHIPFIRDELNQKKARSGTYLWEGVEMTGSVVPVPSLNWHVLVARPTARVFEPLKAAIGITLAGLLSALVGAFLMSNFFAKRLASRFERLTEFSKQIAGGQVQADWRSTRLLEMDHLADNLRHMAQTIGERDAALLASERKFREMLESAHFLAVILDPQGKIIFCNNYLSQLSGWTKEELLGKSWFELFFDEMDGRRHRGTFQMEIEQKEGKREDECPIRTKAGGILKVVWDRTVLFNADRSVSGIAALGVDLTEQKNLEEQLRHSQKMEAVGLLAGGVAHDFNNILMAIGGYCSLIQNYLKPDDPIKAHVDQVVAGAERASQLTRSLLTFSRKQVMLPARVDLNQIVLKFQKLLHRLIGEDIQLNTGFYSAPLPIFADTGQIEQVIANLATNARDAMPSGGTVSIQTSMRTLDAQAAETYGLKRAGKYALLSFSDTGVGISKDLQKKIFDPFFTTKDIGKGTGLGLSIVYGIVQQHHGHISVYSENGKGTTFHIFIPIHETSELKKGEGIALVPSESEVRGGTETILVCEDEPSVRALFEQVLNRAGYKVILASDGEEGLKVFKENETRIDLALMDVIMPQKGGMALYKELVQIKRDLPALFVSGYTADVIRSRAELPLDAELLMKPFQSSELLKRTRKLLDQAKKKV